jgi:hypothetical protein
VRLHRRPGAHPVRLVPRRVLRCVSEPSVLPPYLFRQAPEHRLRLRLPRIHAREELPARRRGPQCRPAFDQVRLQSHRILAPNKDFARRS